jgi:hypothetical protein
LVFAAAAAAVALCVLLLADAPVGRASVCGAEVEYVGPENGSWLSASNWNPAALPTASQTVCIPAGKGTIEVAGGTAQASTLQAKSSVHVLAGATLHIAAGGGVVSLFSGNLVIDAGGKVADDRGRIRTEGDTIVNGEIEGSGAPGENELSLNSFTAQLSGDGKIAVPFASATGEVAPGGSGIVGALTFTKGFAINGNVELGFDLAGAGSFDRIISSQEVSMPSGARFKPNVLASYSPPPSQGQEWEVIQSPVPAIFPGHFLVSEPWELRAGPGGNGANLKLLETLPTPPQAPTLKAFPGNGLATFEVTPTDNGNGLSAEYFVRVQPGNIELPAGFPATGLTNCAVYTATATVRTSAGTSPPSAAVTFTPAGPQGCATAPPNEPPRTGVSGSTTSQPPTGAPAPATVASTPKAIEALALGCTGQRLVLNDVYIRGARVVIAGAAEAKLAGSKVKVLFDQRRQVATATVGHDGRFATTAPLPPRSAREATSTRYSAAIGSLHSLSLKLTRRLLLEAPVEAGGAVTLSGRIAPPLTKPAAPIVVEQELECGHSTIATSFVPAANGRFRVSLPAPVGAHGAIYRLTSRVAANKHATGTGFKTFSLPLPVKLG